MIDGNWTYCGNSFVMYKVWNYYVVYLKLILYVKYNLINKKLKGKSENLTGKFHGAVELSHIGLMTTWEMEKYCM